jgi:predicted DNA-binding protein (MmcQ/YjbR family)
MNLETLRAYLLKQPGAVEDFPFGPEPLVAKVAGKMFALVAFREPPLRVSLKCEPYHALFLRERYAAVRPGYHLNKQHWNTVDLDGGVPDDEVLLMIDESYRLVVKSLSRAAARQLQRPSEIE